MTGFPEVATLSEHVSRVLGLNPGLMTGPGTNTYLVGRDAPVLIDTGAGVAGYLPNLLRHLERARLDEPSRILLTHRHVDHMGGVTQLRRVFPETPVAKLIFRDGTLPVPMESLHDGHVTEVDGLHLLAIHTPGHASDHLSFYLREERALFTGDLILEGTTTVIPPDDGDMAAYLESLRRLLDLDLTRIYPAHGRVIESPKEKIEEYIAHRFQREEMILEALRAGGRTIPEIVATVYVSTPSVLHPVAQLSVESHLIKLEQEGRVRRTAEGQFIPA
ncbi:MAG: MBL fold metallo-hydrolase [Candidatus Rokubacteria bacterium]|nr:MBL fold metallo-hydrolase [Candidatus Rokubacteria bacterium]